MKKCLLSIMLAVILVSMSSCVGASKPPIGWEDDMKSINLLKNHNLTRQSFAATDALGRKINSVKGERDDKLVGLFYFLWQGNEHAADGTSYITEILDNSKIPYSELFDTSKSIMPLKMHYFAEPLYGYYSYRDEWVIRKQMELIINAGVDFLGFDCTNINIYSSSLNVILPVLEDYRLQGFKVPKIMFLTNTDSAERVMQLYDYLYKDNKYSELYFTDTDGGKNPNAKPWISMRREDKAYLSKKVRDSFYLKDSQWPNQPFLDNGFPWIEFERPQKSHDGIVNVSVAQNSGMYISDSVQFPEKYNDNWGRGYTSKEGKNNPDKVMEGANFQEQWDNAIALDPRIVFVTGWNEWVALRLHTDNKIVFFDNFNLEFSRDIEPTKGGYDDNFYLQLIRNIRKFKEGKLGESVTAQKATIDVNGSVEQWKDISSGFVDYSGETAPRNCTDAVNKKLYTDNSGRNDISELRVAADDENVYFLITSSKDITSYESGENWMNLWIGADITDKAHNGYQFLINKKPTSDTKTSLHKYDETKGFTQIAELDYRIARNFMQIKLPKALLNNYNGALRLKVADNVENPLDPMSYYVSGDSAPAGRLAYSIKL